MKYAVQQKASYSITSSALFKGAIAHGPLIEIKANIANSNIHEKLENSKMPVDTIIVMIAIVIAVGFCVAALAWAKPTDSR